MQASVTLCYAPHGESPPYRPSGAPLTSSSWCARTVWLRAFVWLHRKGEQRGPLPTSSRRACGVLELPGASQAEKASASPECRRVRRGDCRPKEERREVPEKFWWQALQKVSPCWW